MDHGAAADQILLRRFEARHHLRQLHHLQHVRERRTHRVRVNARDARDVRDALGVERQLETHFEVDSVWMRYGCIVARRFIARVTPSRMSAWPRAGVSVIAE